MEILKTPARAATAPFRLGLFAMKYTESTLRNTKDLFFPAATQQEFAAELIESRFDHEVELALETYKLGKQRRDPELGFLGMGKLVRLMCHAEKDPRISDQRTGEIASFVLEEGINVELEPVIEDHEVKQATRVLDRFNPVRHIFFHHEK